MSSDASSRGRPKVKICGVTSPDEAALAARLGADYLGLNFHPPSPRHVDAGRAAELAEAARGVNPAIRVVGVFVNLPTAEIEAIDRRVGLDLIQFHGDESLADVAPFAERALRVFRIREQLDPGLVDGWEDVWGYLFDTKHPKLYGGSGESWDFSLLRTLSTDKPTLIAGGLGPANVRAAIDLSFGASSSGPSSEKIWGVDVCSGVEAEPGRKDPGLLRLLFKEIHDGQSPTSS